MAIPNSQLTIWSSQGSVTQSASTYEIIRNALDDVNAPYHSRNFLIYLQGSYGNDTNVYKDSDVDVVICLDQTYYSDTGSLNEGAKATYDKAFVPATYSYEDFKKEVLDWLKKKFGSDVKEGKKAIFIKGNGSRRDADVLVCANHRRYRSSSTGTDLQYDEGICFWTSSGVQIINFPKQHSANCTSKHQITGNRFKPLVRVFKNIRNRMQEGGFLQDGVAPSYFIEGMLWNVPADKFSTNFHDTWVNSFNWLWQADKTQLSCANDLYWLVRDNAQNCWSSNNFDAYLVATRDYWNNWN